MQLPTFGMCLLSNQNQYNSMALDNLYQQSQIYQSERKFAYKDTD